MRTLAVSVAAILVLAVVSPAFAQPFADVPTDHWAFDAIAELAAKGIIEGFPDGTFKGDRGVTRYEVAMIVARILARIEAIKIPAPAAAAPTAPQVTRADVQTIQRLVNEFRAELAALGVRVTAVEEELTALKTKTTNVAVTGDLRIRYHFYPTGSPSGPNAPSTAADANYRNRLTFTGQVTPGVSVTTRVRFGTWRFGTTTTQPQAYPTATFDHAYVNFADMFGLGWRIGAQPYTLGTGVAWSGYGLLFDISNAALIFPGTAPNSAQSDVAGVLAKGDWGGFNFEVADWRVDDVTAYDIITARVETGFLAGWTLGASGLYQHRNGATLEPTAVAGTTPGTVAGAANTNDTGYQVDLKGDLFPGLSLGAAYAGFNPNAGGSSNSYVGWVTLDLSSMGMAMMSPTLTAWYKDYGSATTGTQVPHYTGASTEADTPAFLGWNMASTWGAALDMKLSSNLSGSFTYEQGNQKVGNAPFKEYYFSLAYALAPNTTVSFNYWRAELGSPAVPYDDFYRVQLNYSY